MSREEALAKLDRYATYGPGWDSYGGAAVSPVALAAARRTLSSEGASVPSHIVPLSDGGVNFEYRRAWGTLDVDFLPDGRVEILACDREVQEAVDVDLFPGVPT